VGNMHLENNTIFEVDCPVGCHRIKLAGLDLQTLEYLPKYSKSI
jgi:hypothetical protein